MRAIHLHAVPCAGEDVALCVCAKAVGFAGRNYCEHAAIRQARGTADAGVVDHVEGADVAGGAGVRNVQDALIGRKAEAVGAVEVVGYNLKRAAFGV